MPTYPPTYPGSEWVSLLGVDGPMVNGQWSMSHVASMGRSIRARRQLIGEG
jgi:hypothetical protein